LICTDSLLLQNTANYHKYEWHYWGYKHGQYNRRVNEGRLNMHKSWSTIKSSTLIVYYIFTFNRISGIVFRVLVSCAVDRGFESHSGQTKDYKIGICCFSTKHIALRRKSKDWLARNQNNVSREGRHVYPRTVVSVS
jgi:hypothetical protein